MDPSWINGNVQSSICLSSYFVIIRGNGSVKAWQINDYMRYGTYPIYQSVEWSLFALTNLSIME